MRYDRVLYVMARACADLGEIDDDVHVAVKNQWRFRLG